MTSTAFLPPPFLPPRPPRPRIPLKKHNIISIIRFSLLSTFVFSFSLISLFLASRIFSLLVCKVTSIVYSLPPLKPGGCLTSLSNIAVTDDFSLRWHSWDTAVITGRVLLPTLRLLLSSSKEVFPLLQPTATRQPWVTGQGDSKVLRSYLFMHLHHVQGVI